MSDDPKRQSDVSPDYLRPNDNWCELHIPNTAADQSGSHRTHEARHLRGPSLRLWRGWVAVTITILLGGVLATLLLSPSRNEWLAPGPLTHAHARVLLGAGADRCASCHGAGDRTLSDWMTDAISAGRHIPVSQSLLCMDCHDKNLMAEFALQPHNVSSQRLESLTTAARQNLPAALLKPESAISQFGELACATCHQEHHGADFNLATMTDRQCQTCHASNVHNFEDDHPEFTSWPDLGHRNIAFDHSAHQLRHFPDKNATFECRACHVSKGSGNVKHVAPFETSCAQCHDHDVSGESGPAWTFFQLPMLDTVALDEAGLTAGAWPTQSSSDFDGQLPALMEALLMSDPAAREILQRRGGQVDFAQFDPESTQDLRDASVLAWSTKYLLMELSRDGVNAVLTRLATVLENSTEDGNALASLTERLFNDLPDDAFARAQHAWLPGLGAELSQLDRQRGLPRYGRLPRSVFARPRLQTQDDDLLAENPLANQAIPGATTIKPASAPAPEASATLTAPLPAVTTVPQSAEPSITNPHFPKPNDDEILARNPLEHLRNTAPTDALDTGKISPAEGGRPDVPIVAPDAIRSPAAVAGEGTRESDKRDQLIGGGQGGTGQFGTVSLSGPAGGWIRDDMTTSIQYVVRGHRDVVLQEWTDVALHLASVDAESGLARSDGLLHEFRSPDFTGSCLRCHNAGEAARTGQPMAWQPGFRDASIRDFTRFDHRPHEIGPEATDCTSCHTPHTVIRESERESMGLFSDFEPVTKATCAACHRAGGAPTGCTDCHNYHVGSRVTKELIQ